MKESSLNLSQRVRDTKRLRSMCPSLSGYGSVKDRGSQSLRPVQRQAQDRAVERRAVFTDEDAAGRPSREYADVEVR